MLGRQQIAGIPTAISELFKNAHDAYARTVEIDFYRSDRLFVLRDDGVGMTTEEFLDRWLTIATENRLEERASEKPPPVAGMSARPVLGEKGIGRLAIATIARQVLVLTRPRSQGVPSELTAAFVNWRLFECSGLNLQDIHVPVRSFPGGTLPSRMDIDDMVESFRRRHAHHREAIGEDRWQRIAKDLALFSVDPRDIDSYLRGPSLANQGHGTHFILMPASDRLVDDIDGDPDLRKAPPLKKALLGFTNPLGDNRRPEIHTAFRDHKTDTYTDDLIGENEFFTVDDFENADHQVKGRFDEYGQFQGSVWIYGEEVSGHIINWRTRGGKPTDCGPFSITFAAIEGERKHTTLPLEDYAQIIQKTEKIGGLYIYRDGIRILPYGDTDYDWLEIEFNRTKSAYYYYFSHRKMFGAIAIDSKRNARLHEKAGREGFQENKAYRQLRGILRAFFLQMAADFFRKGGEYSDRFMSRKRQLKEERKHLQKRAAQVYAKRKKFAAELAAFFEKTDRDLPNQEAEQLGLEIEVKLAEARRKPRQSRARAIVNVEREARRELRRIESQYKVSKPRIGLTKALQKEWRDYSVAFKELSANVFRSTHDLIESLVAEEVRTAGVDIEHRLRIDAALNDLAEVTRRETSGERRDLTAELGRVSAGIRDVARRCGRDVEGSIRSSLADFSRRDLSGVDDDDLRAVRESLESPIQEAFDRACTLLESVRSQLAEIDLSGKSSTLDQLAAVEQRNVTLQEEAAADLQLAQLGMAIEIINHEFGATVRSVRNGLQSLKAWADVNDELQSLYGSIRASFDHLDGYLTLFTPLHRRLYRKAVDIRGSEIHDFLADLFRERLARHNVELVQTPSFEKATITGYPSSFYPVFVNLLDNAIYWLSVQSEQLERRITLDARNNVLRVYDTGPGIHRRDRDDIFEYGFTRKPGGRGMGLYISRQALRSVGYDLTLADRKVPRGALFLIGPRREDKDTRDVD